MVNNEMQSSQLSGNKPTASTQAFLDVAEIKEGVIILKDGSMRAVVAVSSVNFSLKSGDEQNALISSYQNFLNSLEFSIQILMQSRKLDIHGYLDKMQLIMQQQTNELLRMQTQEYIEYIKQLIEFASIMNKSFYIVVPHYANVVKEGFMQKVSGLFSPSKGISAKEKGFELSREELIRRVNQVSGGLGGMGLKCYQLKTEELLELLYNSYNLGSGSILNIESVQDLDMAKE
jgi:type IV secretory pathway VirB4 component